MDVDAVAGIGGGAAGCASSKLGALSRFVARHMAEFAVFSNPCSNVSAI